MADRKFSEFFRFFCPEYGPEFLEEFSFFISLETEEKTENSPRTLANFNAKSPTKSEEDIHEICLKSR